MGKTSNLMRKARSWLLWLIAIAAIFLMIRLVEWTEVEQKISGTLTNIEEFDQHLTQQKHVLPQSVWMRTLKLGSALILAGLLGGMIGLRRPMSDSNINILQAHIFLSIAASMMMIIIGSELARAFGLMGAASIVRYRYALQSPKEGSSLVLALGVGIACGTDLFLLAVIGTFLILLIDLTLRRVSKRKEMEIPSDKGRLKYRLKVFVEDESSALILLKEIFVQFKVYYTIESITQSTLIKTAGLHEIVLLCYLENREIEKDVTLNLINQNFHQIRWKFIGTINSLSDIK